jgi:hypothetical protein
MVILINIELIIFKPKLRITQIRNRFTTRNQWFTETIETIRTSGLTLIISTIRFFKTFTAEFGFNNRNNKSKTNIVIR